MKLTFAVFLAAVSLSASALTIGAYNIRNFDYDNRYRITTNKPELATMLRSLKADVLSVEEINNKQEFSNFVEVNFPGHKAAISNCGGQHGQKLGFMYNTKVVELLSFTEDLSVSDPGREGSCHSGSRPLAIALFRIISTGQKFYGITAHVKSGGDPQSVNKRSRQFEIIKNILKDLTKKSDVKDFYVAGDMNTTEYLNRGVDFQIFTKFVSDLGATNLMANAKCSAYWWGGTEDGMESPSLLDHLVVSQGLLKMQTNATVHGHCKKMNCEESTLQDLGISYESVSDHCPLTATIQ